jgi:radical SAM superfamily enzyme YgiQ (UPF0313 family)
MVDKKKIILVDACSTWLKKNEGQTDQVVLPLGLMYLSSHLKQQFGDSVDTSILHSVVDIKSDEQLREIIEREKPDIVGIRTQTVYRDEFHNVAKTVKETSDALVIAGGPHVSSDLDDVLNAGVDIAVIGEGEHSLAEIVAGKKKEEIIGIAYREDGRTVRTIPRVGIDNLDVLPFPDYDNIDMDKYESNLSYGFNFRKQGVVTTSRGCQFTCDFCHTTLGKKSRLRSAENVLDEIQELSDRGIKDIYFVDDIFNINRKRALEIFRGISERDLGLRLYFVNGLRGDLVNEEFIDSMVEAGTIWVSYAIETASPRLQKEIGKHLSLPKVRRAIEYSAQQGIIVNYWGLLGSHTETEQEAHQTIDFMESLPPSVIPYLFALKPFKGTDAHEKAQSTDDDLGSVYHNFAHLFRRNRFYMNVVRRWRDSVWSEDRLQRSTSILQNNGYSNEEIRAAYGVLYSSMDKSQLEGLLGGSK